MEGAKLASDIKYLTDYARFLEDEGRVESWVDSVTRVMDMHRTKYATQIGKYPELARAIDFAEESYLNRHVLGSQRALQWGGAPMLKHEAKMYNCLSTYVDRVSFFQECMYFLLCGCGTGFSVQKHHIDSLPLLSPRAGDTLSYVIPDSIEGWSDAIGILINSYLSPLFIHKATFPLVVGHKVEFDYSLIRPKGSKISGGFKAPGPEGLKVAISKIENLLDNALKGQDHFSLSPIMAYDIVMFFCDAVLSGGVRRSATICLFSPDDEEMLNAKTGRWMEENPQRARSNNSAVLVRDEVTEEQFMELFNSVKQFGEPGFIFVEDKDITVNPCVTKDTTVLTSTGVYTVEDLIDVPFKAVIDGNEYNASGFWKTGIKPVFKLSTKEGFNLKLTDNHKILTIKGWKEAKDLIVGDKLKLQNHGKYLSSNNTVDFEKGWLVGNLVGDGTFDGRGNAILRYWKDELYLGDIIARDFLNKNFSVTKNFTAEPDYKDILSFSSVELAKYAEFFGIIQGNKAATKELEKTHIDFQVGYLKGLFDADGSVQGTQAKGCSVRLTQNNLEILEQVQRILLRLGINSTIYKNRRAAGYYKLPDGKGSKKDYFCQAVHELIISKVNLVDFSNKIGFFSIAKQDKMDTIISSYKRKPNKDSFEATFESLEYIGEESVYDVTVEEVHCFDANGLTAHNCVEIGMWPQTESGVSGWQGCNLTTINGLFCTNEHKFYQACRASAILGTLQAGYTDLKYVGKETIQIFEREALLGCSVTGWANNPDVLFDTDVQREGAEIIKGTNRVIAQMLGINPAARTTCVKPEGNSSVVLQCASGIHGEHAPMYFRNMQMNKSSDVAQAFAKHNPDAVEESVWNKGGTDWIFSIPIVAPKDSLFKRHLVGINQLELVRLTQNNWVEYGTTEELCVNPIVRHNVSNTIQISDWDEVGAYIYKYRKDFAGISLIGVTGDKDYAQAPFTEVFSRETLIEFYGDAALFASGLIVDGMHVFNDDLWWACREAGSNFEGLDEGQKDWCRRAIKFAKNYFNEDFWAMTYCLKDIYNYHKWCKINSNLVNIDWAKENIAPNYIDVDTMASAACIGGVCEI